MAFAKLNSAITESSLWSEDLHVRIVFLSFLARKDETGFVSGARSGLIRVCNVTAEQFDDAVLKLSSPDPESKTPDFEGRRISKIDGGYVVLNSDKYRLPEDTKKENHRLYMQKWREERENVNSREITNNHTRSPSVSVSASVSSSESVFSEFWKLYPKKKDKGHAIKAWSKIKKPVETLEKIKKALEWHIEDRDERGV